MNKALVEQIREDGVSGEDLRGADLPGADLSWTDLRDVDFRNADLRGVDFRNADLRGVYLREADLREADFRGADLRGADLRGADLTDTGMMVVQVLELTAYVTPGITRVGCQVMKNSEWLAATEAQLGMMDPDADRYLKFLPVLIAAIKAMDAGT